MIWQQTTFGQWDCTQGTNRYKYDIVILSLIGLESKYSTFHVWVCAWGYRTSGYNWLPSMSLLIVLTWSPGMPSASWYFPNVVCSKINGSSSLDSDSETGKLECLFFITGVPPSFTFSVWYTMHIFNLHCQTCCEVQGWFPLSPHFPAHSVPCGLVFAHCLLLHQLLLFQHYCLYKGQREVLVYVATSSMLE